ncbi:hypothetical protein EVAR_87778_1 [Eumeta japonica]|uniref:Uncharacterized protein n=1 Tax=Eumeta variegata TaxID=151549 RepID=A0A4C1X3B1_EUMVA|nr:hypothetical protein EVAR_87778_1 [Eumeta japonica]
MHIISRRGAGAPPLAFTLRWLRTRGRTRQGRARGAAAAGMPLIEISSIKPDSGTDLDPKPATGLNIDRTVG